MNRLVLGVICAGKRDGSEDVKRDLSIRCGVINRLELAMMAKYVVNTETEQHSRTNLPSRLRCFIVFP